MTNQTPLNPDALEAGAKALLHNPESWNDERYEWSKELFRAKAERAIRAYLAVAQPEVKP